MNWFLMRAIVEEGCNVLSKGRPSRKVLSLHVLVDGAVNEIKTYECKMSLKKNVNLLLQVLKKHGVLEEKEHIESIIEEVSSK
jgi:hypothetical protein